ncbi:MAG: ornithine cyclodeaminase family protein [Akkermansiaceae bacterium]|nr:ornithine cyclodeaminase family protein [Akkermansiaceae bacterium]MCP5543280.1 ornithine cyclodeaminase family protein [Akkermansiaceae bacterium]
MKLFDSSRVHQALRFPEFIDELERCFAGDFTMPARQVMPLDPGGPGHDAFAMLPAWNDQVIALKAFTYFPKNEAPDLTVYAKILLFDRRNGVPLAMVDGTSVTYFRTAGVSALAARLLSREESEEMLLINTGRLAPYLARAHVSVRPLKRMRIWGRNPDKAARLAAELAPEFPGLEITSVDEIERACATADLIVCATNSHEPLVRGGWVKPGAHVNLFGNHHADKRECDTDLVVNAGVWVDSMENCMREAGEILVPIQEGRITADHVLGELRDLCRRESRGRQGADEITMFKSVGCALGDLAGAKAVFEGADD